MRTLSKLKGLRREYHVVIELEGAESHIVLQVGAVSRESAAFMAALTWRSHYDVGPKTFRTITMVRVYPLHEES